MVTNAKAGTMQYDVDRYAIQYPKRHIEEQVLQVVCSLALDFSIGAEKFIKGCAKKMKLRDPDKSSKPMAVVPTNRARLHVQ